MRRLIERGLMFANLFEVATPALVARYNSALEKLTGKRTELTSFHIDLSGHAPEIGDELGDPLYLNPRGHNRQFILLSTAQRKAPLLEATFTSSARILKEFIDDNRDALFALTARDAVLGELENSVWALRSPADLMEVRTVRVAANTVSGLIADTRRLKTQIETLENSDDAWADDAFLGDMLALARRLGDVRVQKFELQRTAYPLGNFFTSHFGGLWVFRDAALPAVIHLGPRPGIERASVIDFRDRAAVLAFLEQNNLVELIEVACPAAETIFRERTDFILIRHLADQGMTGLEGLREPDLRALRRRNGEALPPEFAALAAAADRLARGGSPPPADSADPACFYRLRARPGPDRWLANHLLAALTPMDPRQLFICNKEAFYESYRGWPEPMKDWVVAYLARDYLPDKAGRRKALLGYGEGETTPVSPWDRGRAAR